MKPCLQSALCTHYANVYYTRDFRLTTYYILSAGAVVVVYSARYSLLSDLCMCANALQFENDPPYM